MKKYMVCRDCGKYFPAEDVVTRRELHYEIAQDGYVPFEEFDACPFCHSDSIENVETCPICGEPHEEITAACPRCKAKIAETWSWAKTELLDALFTEDDEGLARDAISEVMEELI